MIISVFYSEHREPHRAAADAQDDYNEWQKENDIEILQIATSACQLVGERGYGFWLTIYWRWNEDPQRWSGGDMIPERTLLNAVATEAQ